MKPRLTTGALQILRHMVVYDQELTGNPIHEADFFFLPVRPGHLNKPVPRAPQAHAHYCRELIDHKLIEIVGSADDTGMCRFAVATAGLAYFDSD